MVRRKCENCGKEFFQGRKDERLCCACKQREKYE